MYLWNLCSLIIFVNYVFAIYLFVVFFLATPEATPGSLSSCEPMQLDIY